MYKKAVFVDFYGTLVKEDDEVVNMILDEIANNGNGYVDKPEILSYWWDVFSSLFANSYDDKFSTKRDLMTLALQTTIDQYKAKVNPAQLARLMFKHWQKPPIFPEIKEFFVRCPIPVCILSNADRHDIDSAIGFHRMKPDLVVCSEDVHAYKPRSEMFRYALDRLDLQASEVVHIGDSISSDVVGAHNEGIDVIWLNRTDKPISDFMQKNMVCTNMLEAITIIMNL